MPYVAHMMYECGALWSTTQALRRMYHGTCHPFFASSTGFYYARQHTCSIRNLICWLTSSYCDGHWSRMMSSKAQTPPSCSPLPLPLLSSRNSYTQAHIDTRWYRHCRSPNNIGPGCSLYFCLTVQGSHASCVTLDRRTWQ